MKKILFAVLIVSAIIGCIEEKTDDPLGPREQIPRKEGGAKFGDGAKSSDPFPEGKQNHNCLWCGNVIDAAIKSRIILNPSDPLNRFPINPEFSNAHFCGLKCFNDFKKTHLNNIKTEIVYNDSTKVYSILLSK